MSRRKSSDLEMEQLVHEFGWDRKIAAPDLVHSMARDRVRVALVFGCVGRKQRVVSEERPVSFYQVIAKQEIGVGGASLEDVWAVVGAATQLHSNVGKVVTAVKEIAKETAVHASQISVADQQMKAIQQQLQTVMQCIQAQTVAASEAQERLENRLGMVEKILAILLPPRQ